jgi:tRNA-specific 2-thiouridylase
MNKNEVYVTTNLDDEHLWSNQLQLTDLHWINEPTTTGKTYQIRSRYRAPLVKGEIKLSGNMAVVTLIDQIRAITPGQSAVVYDGDRVVGGGIVK